MTQADKSRIVPALERQENEIGDLGDIWYEPQHKEAPVWRGPGKIVNTNDDGVRDVVTYDIAGNKETTGGEEYEGGEVDDNHARCTRPLF